ncbi:repeatdomain containing protein [Pyrenophora tritici-repentis]|uniref:DUF3824 domain-containing protein n=1 Tax=Pyrenophora tritici-repentis TaxID=45151 RepID=A0A834VX26_9PLEO|nr:hypothetical protein PtrM4_030830 [Pyrenophora tritici-repentis]KAI0588812.1 DUF3824 multi-domain protein [Pyrenophora tritici-repentis]KAI1548694.1 repeatdomain containing protein [Pyrenophora tritici-repentis]KAI1552824.1 repeatdomain containing protein [Pyrenophora tritici-repentis]KAI1558032.1 repeatdomain containing protein [Pyrenophora tritici-repentis]
MSVIYKRSERDREWETTSSRAGGGSGAGYTTVRRYKVPDHSLEEDTYESEMRLVHRGRDDFDERRSVKEYAVERDTQPVREVRHYRYAEREPSPVRSEYRIQREYEREYEREPSPARTEIRISRDYERDHEIFPREHQPYELEKYSRSTEQVARPARQEEDYYYERRVKEVDRGRYDDRYEDRWGDRAYYSDDDIYIHKEKDTWGGSETHTKRDVAAGALAGVAAGQIIRHHRKRKGEAAGGSIGNALGYGTLGAVSAVALDRSRSTSKHLDPKHRNDRAAQVGLASAAVAGLVERRRSKSRKREGKRSPSKARQGVPIAAAGLTGAAVTGLYEKHKAKKEARAASRSKSRSRSRTRTVAETAAVAGVAGLAAHEAAKRRDRKKAEKEAERRREEDTAYSTSTYSPYDSPTSSTAHPDDSRYFPETNYFPPPPSAPVDHNPNNPYPPYNPADYPPGPQSTYEPNHPSQFVNPPHNDLHPGNPYAPPQQQQDFYYGQPRHPDDNVSAPVPDHGAKEHYNTARGPPVVEKSRSSSKSRGSSSAPEEEKSVKFDLNPQEEPARESTPESDHEDRDNHENSRSRRRSNDDRSDMSNESGRERKRHHRDESPGSDASDATIELPPRFDERGRERDVDPLADNLERVLQSIFR